MRRRFLSFFLAAVMVCSTIPQTAYAKEDGAAAEVTEEVAVAEETAVEEATEDTADEVVAATEVAAVVTTEKVAEIVAVEATENAAEVAEEVTEVAAATDDAAVEAIEEVAATDDAAEATEEQSTDVIEAAAVVETVVEDTIATEETVEEGIIEDEDLGEVAEASLFEYELNDKNRAVITKYNGSAATVEIPATIDGKTVEEIASGAFEWNSNLQKITMPNTITMIRTEAFFGCDHLTSVQLSSGLKEIGYAAFGQCTALTSVSIPKSLDKGGWAFRDCYGLKTVTFESGVSEIAEGLFAGCNGLESIVIPNTVVTIEYQAFRDCKNLKQVSIPDSVKTIEAEAFIFTSSLQSISIPDSVTYIGDAAFKESGLTEVVLPDSVTEVGSYTFENCASLAKLTLSKNLQKVGFRAFCECALTDIEIPKSLEEGNQAFQGCVNLKNITFEKGIKTIPYGLFWACNALESIEIPNTVVLIQDDAFRDCENLTNVTIPNSVTTIGQRSFNNCVCLEEIVIPEGVTAIRDSAFQYCYGLKKVELPNSIITIDANAFESCELLEKVTLPVNLQELGYQAFAFCNNLQEVWIPKNLKNAYWSFDNCDKLNTVIFEKGTDKIVGFLFAGCTGLEQFEIPNTVKTIESGAFKNCANLVNVTIPTSVTEIKDRAFEECVSLKEVVMPDSVISVREKAFNGCTALESVTFSQNLSTLEGDAFYKCEKLKEVVLPNSLTELAYRAFAYDTSLEKVVLPKDCKEIAYGAFQGCSSLIDITFSENLTTIKDCAFEGTGFFVMILPRGVKEIGPAAFRNCDKLMQVTLKDTVTSIGNGCFEDCDALADVTLSTGLKEIPPYTFNLCPKLSKIVIPYAVTKIGDQAFGECTRLTAVTLPKNITDIDDNAFNYYNRMTFYGVAGTYAQEFATEKGASFMAQTVEATYVSLDPSSLKMYVDDEEQLAVSVAPVDFTDTVAWRTSNKEVVTVENGLVRAIAPGTATIRVIAGDQVATCNVTVSQAALGVYLNTYGVSMEASDTFQLEAEIGPDNATNKAVIWSSSDSTVATVSETGLVTGLKKGTAKITATAADGRGAKATCTVEITNDVTLCTEPTQMESAHNYKANFEGTWVYSLPGASQLVVTFDSRTVFDECDFLYVYDAERNCVGEYTESQLAGKTITVPGDTVRLKLVTDEVLNMWGFKVTSITAKSAALTGKATISGTATCGKTLTVKLANTNNTGTLKYQWKRDGVSIKGATLATYKTVKEDIGTKITCVVKSTTETGSVTSSGVTISLAAPTTTVKAAANGVTVSWNKVIGEDGYRIYRKEEGGSYEKIATVKAGADTTYVDTTAVGGIKYYYAVKAYAGTTAGSYVSASVVALPGTPTPKLTLMDTGVKVSWNVIEGAEEYYVYRKQAGTSYAKIATVSGKNYFLDKTAEGGQEYYYTVKAYANGKVSGYESKSIVYGLTAPTTTVKAAAGSVTVTWNKVSGAAGYRVYRKVDGGAYAKIATVTADKAASYVDKTVVGGTKYYYAVKAYNDTMTSTYVSANVVAILPTPATKITLVTTGVKVSWNLIDGAEGYYVYRKVVGGSYEQIADITGKNYFLDKTAVKGKQYYYTVKAYANGKVSGYTSVLTTVPKR